MSLPMRGAWIEILSSCFFISSNLSLPMRGAWIEIAIVCTRSAHTYVAPHAGSVD